MIRSGARWLALALALGGCVHSTPMARSPAAVPEQALYVDDAEEQLADATTSAPEEDARRVEDEMAGGEPMPTMPMSPASREALDMETSGVDIESERATTASTGSSGAGYAVPNLGTGVPVEPLPWVPLDPAPVPAGPRRVLLATMEVPPGRTIFPPVSACQDVLVYVRDGVLEAMGTGVGSSDAPATLYPGDAVRFGPEGDGRLTNRSGLPASALVVIARAADRGAPLYTAPVDAGLCELAVSSDPVVRPSRTASAATTAPLVVNEGHLSVRILLDLDGTAAAHAGLALLEGDASMRVASHVHDEADEILYVEEGEGLMTVGDERVAVHPGSVLYIPHGLAHAFEPSGTSPFVAVQLYAPSGPEQRFRGL